MATFLVTESAGFFIASRVNDPADEQYLRSQLASPSFYIVEGAVLGSGAVCAVLYGYWPGFLMLGGPALMLMQRGLLHQPLQHRLGGPGHRSGGRGRGRGVLDLAELMAAADRALYRAKHDGRNRVDGTDARRRPAPLSAS